MSHSTYPLKGLARDVAVWAGIIYALKFVPEHSEAPRHYWIRWIIPGYIFPTDPKVLQESSDGLRKATSFAWPAWKVWDTSTRLLDDHLSKPIFSLVCEIERTIRRDWQPVTQAMEQNVRVLTEQNVVYQEQLDKLEPVAQVMLDIVELSQLLTIEVDQDIQQSEKTIEKLREEVKDITAARQKIDVEAAQEAARKVAAFVKKTLSDPDFIDGLKTQDERMSRTQKQLEEAVSRLNTAQKRYGQAVETLTQLYNEYEELGFEQKAEVQKLKTQVEQLIQKPSELKADVIIHVS